MPVFFVAPAVTRVASRVETNNDCGDPMSDIRAEFRRIEAIPVIPHPF